MAYNINGGVVCASRIPDNKTVTISYAIFSEKHVYMQFTTCTAVIINYCSFSTLTIDGPNINNICIKSDCADIDLDLSNVPLLKQLSLTGCNARLSNYSRQLILDHIYFTDCNAHMCALSIISKTVRIINGRIITTNIAPGQNICFYNNHIKKLTLHGDNTAADNMILTNLPQLQSLLISSFKIDGAMIICCKNLTTLAIDNMVTVERTLCLDIPNIVSLDLDVSAASIVWDLKNWTQLKKLHVHECRIADGLCIELPAAGKSTIQSLSFNICRTNNINYLPDSLIHTKIYPMCEIHSRHASLYLRSQE